MSKSKSKYVSKYCIALVIDATMTGILYSWKNDKICEEKI